MPINRLESCLLISLKTSRLNWDGETAARRRVVSQPGSQRQWLICRHIRGSRAGEMSGYSVYKNGSRVGEFSGSVIYRNGSRYAEMDGSYLYIEGNREWEFSGDCAYFRGSRRLEVKGLSTNPQIRRWVAAFIVFFLDPSCD
ncbi:MAG: hypothetical protein AB9903_20980 [Vulcanimicrobiota bacterium]